MVLDLEWQAPLVAEFWQEEEPKAGHV